MKKLNRLFAILFAVLGVTTLKAQTDVTSQYVKNPTFTSKDNWTIKNAGTNNPAASNNCLEFWGGGNSSLYLLAHQEITNLPNGVYRLTVNAFNRSAAGMPGRLAYQAGRHLCRRNIRGRRSFRADRTAAHHRQTDRYRP